MWYLVKRRSHNKCDTVWRMSNRIRKVWPRLGFLHAISQLPLCIKDMLKIVFRFMQLVAPTCRLAEQSGPLLFPTSWSQHLPSFPDHHHHHLGDQHVHWSNVEHCGSSVRILYLMVEKLGFPIQPKPRQQLAQDLLRLLCIINCEVVLLNDPFD